MLCSAKAASSYFKVFASSIFPFRILCDNLIIYQTNCTHLIGSDLKNKVLSAAVSFWDTDIYHTQVNRGIIVLNGANTLGISDRSVAGVAQVNGKGFVNRFVETIVIDSHGDRLGCGSTTGKG